MIQSINTALTEQEATVLIARAGDFYVASEMGGGLSAPIWLATLARMELDSYAHPTGTAVDWGGVWALVRCPAWNEAAATQMRARGFMSSTRWAAEWLAPFGIGAEFADRLDARFESSRLAAA